MFQDGGVPAYGVCPRERDKRGPGLERRGAGDLICALHHDCLYLFDSLLLRQLNEETLTFRAVSCPVSLLRLSRVTNGGSFQTRNSAVKQVCVTCSCVALGCVLRWSAQECRTMREGKFSDLFAGPLTIPFGLAYFVGRVVYYF